MSIRTTALLLGLSLFIALTGCAGASVPVAIPTVAALPTSTPRPPTATPPPPTWTPQPTAPPDCGQVVAETGHAASTFCGGISAGTACLVASSAQVIQASGESVPFGEPGTTALLNTFQRIDTAAYDPARSSWGMAALNIATSAPGGEPGSAVTAILFGETALFDASGGAAPFQQIYLHTGWVDGQCDLAPLPGVLFQSAAGTAWLTINGLPVQFDGSLLVRAQASDQMWITVLRGAAQATLSDGTLLDAPAGGTIQTPLGGDNGYLTIGPLTLQPLEPAQMTYLPLVALPRVAAVAPPLRPTDDGPSALEALATFAVTQEPSPTPSGPFEGTPPGGIYLTYGGDSIQPGTTVTGSVPPGGTAVWAFIPAGLAPDSYDNFEVEALSEWDPMITLESATWGMYIENKNNSDSTVENFIAPLAGSGGGWRIIISDANGSGGTYRLRYICRGPCPPVSDPAQ